MLKIFKQVFENSPGLENLLLDRLIAKKLNKSESQAHTYKHLDKAGVFHMQWE